jgi:hypothetical protein
MSKRPAREPNAPPRSTAARSQRSEAAKTDPAAGSPAKAAKRVRITVDLDRADHRALRRWVAEEETDAQRVIRALLGELFRDARLAARVRAQVEGTRFR